MIIHPLSEGLGRWIMDEEGCPVKEKKKKEEKIINLRWLAPSTILRWWRRDGIRRNCGGEWDCWPRAVVAVDGAATPLNLRNLLPMLLLFWLLVVAVMVAEVRSGPDIWTRRKKAKCCEQHLYNDLQALFDGVSKPNVFSSFCVEQTIRFHFNNIFYDFFPLEFERLWDGGKKKENKTTTQ